ncbi:MAG: allantoinase [Bacillus sp. (in: firmicutes)]
MTTFDLIIRNGFVVLPHKVLPMDIGIQDGKIAEMTDHIDATGLEERDESGNYIFPGMIDVHVHFSEPGRAHWEGFETGSQMMAAGGCTTYFDMPLNGIPSTVTKAALLEKEKIGLEKSWVDFGLWGGLVPQNLDHLEELAQAGVVGFKAFMSSSGNDEFERVDDDTLLKGMKKIASLGKILALHAESAAITDFLKEEKERLGQISADDYLETRPIKAEAEAVERALTYADITGCSLHFVHISSAAAIEKITAAKNRGLDVTVETCPHYLLFNHHDLIEKGAIAKCAPPLRKVHEQEKLISLFLNNQFDLISSDHSPSPFNMKDPAAHTLFQAWGGISGGQFSLLAMIELAQKYKFSFSKIAQMTALTPATRFGLSDQKGEIKIGLDADFAIVSTKQAQTITEDNFFAKHKQSLYIGHTFPCSIMSTIQRGKVIFENGSHTKQCVSRFVV